MDRLEQKHSNGLNIDPEVGKRPGLVCQLWRKFAHCYWPTVSFCGVQMSWAVQVGYVTPVLRELGLKDSNVSYVWLAGPLSGILVQPIVGVYSDKCTCEYGRRRIFILAGTILSIFGLFMFSNAKQLGYSFGDTEDSHGAALALAVFAFWMLDFSINVAQGPLRALLADVVPAKFHPRSNALFAAHNGLGKLLGYGLGAAALTSAAGLAFFKTEVRALYTICAIVVGITAFMTIRNTPEKQWKPPATGDSKDQDSQHNSFSKQPETLKEVLPRIWFGLKNIPKPIARAMAVQFMAYFVWDCIFIYGSDWVGKEVYGGDPNATEGSVEYLEFEEGVRAANLGYMLMALINIFYAGILPTLCSRFGSRLIWGTTFLLHALLMFSSLAVKEGQKASAVCILALMGFPLAAAYQIPWSIVTVTLSKEELQGSRGLYTTIFNLSQSAPEVLISILGGPCVTIFNGKIVSVLALGGIGALIGTALCYRVVEPPGLYKQMSDEDASTIVQIDLQNLEEFEMPHRKGDETLAVS